MLTLGKGKSVKVNYYVIFESQEMENYLWLLEL